MTRWILRVPASAMLLALILLSLCLGTDRVLGQSPVAPAQGLVARYALEGTALDSSGTGNHGTIMGLVSFVPGPVGQAAYFIGTSYIEAPAANLPKGDAARTFALWTRLDAIVSEEAFFAGYGQFGTYNAAFVLGAYRRSGDARQSVFFSQWGSGIGCSACSDLAKVPSMDLGRWYHLAVTSAQGVTTLYLNGAPLDSQTLSVNTPANTLLYLGGLPGSLGATRRFTGALDEVRVYDRVLSAAEIQQLVADGQVPLDVVKPDSTVSDTGAIPPDSMPADSTISGAGTPVLAVSPTWLELDAAPQETLLTLRDAGSGRLDWALWIVSETADWLSVQGPAGSTDQGLLSGSGDATMTLHTTGAGLVPGRYQAVVYVHSNGGDAHLAVAMRVAGTPEPGKVTAPAAGLYLQWQATSDTLGVRWPQTASQAAAALAVDLPTAAAAIRRALDKDPADQGVQMGILTGSADTAYACARGTYAWAWLLRSTDGGRTWTSIWSQLGSVDDWQYNRAGPVAVDPLTGMLWIGSSLGLYRGQTPIDQPPGARNIVALAVDPVAPSRLWVASGDANLDYAGRISGLGLFRRREEAGTVAWEDMTAGLTREVVSIGFDAKQPNRVYLRLQHLRGSPDVVSAEVPDRITPEQVGWVPVATAPATLPVPFPPGSAALRVRPSYPTDLLIAHGMDIMNAKITGYPLSLGGVVYAETYCFFYGRFSRGLARSRDGGVSWQGVGGFGGYEHGQMGAGKALLFDNREGVLYAGNGLPGIAGQSLGPWTAHPLDASTVYQSQVGRGHLYRSDDLSTWEELSTGLDPMLHPRAVAVDSLSRVYLVTDRGTFVHQDLARPYRIRSLAVIPDTLYLGEKGAARLVARIEAADGTPGPPVVTATCWGREYPVPRQPDGTYNLVLPSVASVAPGFYGVTVTAAPPGVPLARASATCPVMVAPGLERPIAAEGIDAVWAVEVRTGALDPASLQARTGAASLAVNGEVVFRYTDGLPIHPFGYQLEFYAAAADTSLLQGLQINGLDLQSLGARRQPAEGPGNWYRIDLPAERLLVAPNSKGLYGDTQYSPAWLDAVDIVAVAWPGQAVYLDDLRLVPVGREDLVSPTAVLGEPATQPHTFRLSPNYPNPFNASTAISFELARDGPVRLDAYNLLGQPVRLLLSAPLAAGRHLLAWDGRADNNRSLASGVYLVRLESGGQVRMVKVILLR